jgi:hypothetical protein
MRQLAGLGSGGRIVDVNDYQVIHEVDFGWPAYGGGLRWSPTEPNVMYYTGGGYEGCAGPAFVRYVIDVGPPVTAQREIVRCFIEYADLDRDPSYEEISIDGRKVSRDLRQLFFEIYVGMTSFRVLTMIGDSAGTISLASGGVASIASGGTGLMATTEGGSGTLGGPLIHRCGFLA